ncbi:hypothetical protein CEK26_006791 [Fusarium fujikuroi]|nr:hypothetical protein CEK27_006804 [Fusarium fujikuroi]QGI80004.1 hypothetical protein CEK25_006733 [Fusarium fujikuroi]QGI93722.1 hypothetical protein CEK26_006791 [Fusarium fujikuroi]
MLYRIADYMQQSGHLLVSKYAAIDNYYYREGKELYNICQYCIDKEKGENKDSIIEDREEGNMQQ